MYSIIANFDTLYFVLGDMLGWILFWISLGVIVVIVMVSAVIIGVLSYWIHKLRKKDVRIMCSHELASVLVIMQQELEDKALSNQALRCSRPLRVPLI